MTTDLATHFESPSLSLSHGTTPSSLFKQFSWLRLSSFLVPSGAPPLPHAPSGAPSLSKNAPSIPSSLSSIYTVRGATMHHPEGTYDGTYCAGRWRNPYAPPGRCTYCAGRWRRLSLGGLLALDHADTLGLTEGKELVFPLCQVECVSIAVCESRVQEAPHPGRYK